MSSLEKIVIRKKKIDLSKTESMLNLSTKKSISKTFVKFSVDTDFAKQEITKTKDSKLKSRQETTFKNIKPYSSLNVFQSLQKKLMPAMLEANQNFRKSQKKAKVPKVKNLSTVPIKASENFNHLDSSIHYEKLESPKMRSHSEQNPPYSETIAVNEYATDLKKPSKLEFSKCLPLDIYDPVIEQKTPHKELEDRKKNSPELTGYSKWFFGNGTYEWRVCSIDHFDTEKEKYLITWPNGVQKYVSRLNLRFSEEEENIFETRIHEARKYREAAEISIRYNFLITRNELKDPQFSTKVIDSILKYIQGKPTSDLTKYRNPETYAKFSTDFKFNPQRFIWKNELSHFIDETTIFKHKGFQTHSEFLQNYIENIPDFKLFSYPPQISFVKQKKFRNLALEVAESWVVTSKHVDFDRKHKKTIENSAFSSKLTNPNAKYRDSFSVALPVLDHSRFLPIFLEFKQNSFLSNMTTIKIIQRIHDTILSLDNFSIFPNVQYKNIDIEKFISAYSIHSDKFFNEIQNVIFDSQCDIQEILMKEDEKRVQRNNLKLKERTHSKQVIELELGLPEELINFMRKLIKVCTMKIEDKIRECLNISLKFTQEQFGVDYDSTKSTDEDLTEHDLAAFRNTGSKFLNISLVVDLETKTVRTNPLPEVLKGKIFAFLDKVLNRIAQIRCIATAQTGPSRPNFLLSILEINSERYQKSIEKLRKKLEFQFKILKTFIKRLESYYFCIDLVPAEQKSEFKKKSNDEIENEIFRLKRNQLEIAQVLESSKCNLGIWTINGKSVQKSFCNNIEKVVQVLFEVLIEDSYDRIYQINQQYEEVLSVIASEPKNIEELDDIKKFISKNYEAKTDFIYNELNTIFSNIETLEGYKHYIDSDLYSKTWTCMGYFPTLEDIKEKSMVQIDQLLIIFTSELLEENKQLCVDIENIGQKLEVLKKEEVIEDQERVSLEFTLLKSEFQSISDRAQLINSREVLIGEQPTDFKVLDEIRRDFNPYSRLWSFVHEFALKHPTWMKGPISSLNRDSISSDVNTYISEVSKMEKVAFKDNPAALRLSKEFLQKVNDFKPYIPVIRVFNNPGMKERHWSEIREEKKLSDINKNNCLDALIEIKILDYLDLLNTTSDKATKELSLENAKKSMESSWNSVNFELNHFRGSYILVNNEVIWDMIFEQTSKTETMIGSQNINFIISEMKQWKNNLERVHNVLEIWEKFQRNWQYLQPIFSSNDISKQLHQPSINFRKVNSNWESIMTGVYSNPNVMECCLNTPKLSEIFTSGNKTLEEILKSLNEYLQAKRKAFPRFYFLSNEELVLILSNSQDLVSIQRYIIKCFEGIGSVIIENKKIVGMVSPEGEKVRFNKAIEFYIDEEIKSIEIWMIDIENEMKNCLHDQLNKAIKEWSQDLKALVSRWPSQIIHASVMSLWTYGVENSIYTNTLKAFYSSQEEKMNKLVEIVRGKLERLEQLTFSTMVVIDVHNKDIIENLIQRQVTSVNDFAWFCNMRFYLVSGQMQIKMLDCMQEYGYEYLGNQNRLVITALTDRCCRTLMSALEVSLGGAPEGPAGTGKTETVKDLAKSIAKKCVVFNCSDRLDHLYMAKFFTGLCYSGAWACFDEFNRIELQVLSVIAEQILSIQIAVQNKKETFELDDDTVKLNPSCAVFITMNPDYAGRSKLPDNLKALFRPVAMMVPDYSMIAEIYLYSFGFRDARNLARKIVNSLRLASEQLSTQPHYDYGMRAVSTIINAAGRFKKEQPTNNEEILVLKAIKSTNIPKFVAQDIPLFSGIVLDLFPGVKEEEASEGELALAIANVLAEENLIASPKFVDKALEIYRTVLLRHGLMVVGETLSGKTSAIYCLSKALLTMSRMEMHYINPKSMTLELLYGASDPVSQDWKDGVLAQGIRNFSENSNDGFQWIVLDGPVDAKWIESMNTVMDDNKKLCLTSGEIIKLTPSIRLLFEVDDLSQASPATVSRCGMIYMDPEETLGPMPLIRSWILDPPWPFKTFRHRALFEKLFTDLFIPVLEFWKTAAKFDMPVSCSVGHVTLNMINLFQSLILKKGKSRKQQEIEGSEELKNLGISKQNSIESPAKVPIAGFNIISKENLVQEALKVVKPDEVKKEDDRLTSLFVVAIQWSLSGPCKDTGRKLINQKLREVAVNFLSNLPENLEDYYYDGLDKNWIEWKSKLSSPSKDSNPSNLLVNTVPLISYSFILYELVTRKVNILVTGDTGTGKTVLVNSILQQLDPKFYLIAATMLSARTSCTDTQNFVESGLIKRRKGYFGPESGKFRIFLIDDFNMPAKEQFDAQPALEFLRIAIERKEIYDRNTLEMKFLEDIQCLGIMGHPGGGRNKISSRTVSKFFVLNFTNYDKNSLFHILTTLLNLCLNNHATSILELIPALSNAIIEVFNKVTSQLPPTPSKNHYTFNLRDLSSLVKGICLSPPSKLNSPNVLYKLWTHECLRVFSDRLIDGKDKEILNTILEEAMKEHFSMKMKNLITGDLIFSNCLDDKIYQECNNRAKLKQCIENYLDDYNSESNSVKMNLLIFDYAIEHITRIARVLTWNNGNLLLIGVGGSGRMSLTKLSAYFLKMTVCTIKLAKTYGMAEWQEDLKSVLKLAGQDEKKVVFLLRDSEIIMEVFLESVNNILNSGQAPNLFSTDEIQGISEVLKDNKNYSMMNVQQRFEQFTQNVKKNLHIALCMIQGEVMRTRIRQFPSLVNCCTIDWYTEWPDPALAEVARYFIKEENITDSAEKLESSIKLCVGFHSEVRSLSASYLQEYKRHNYVTPTHYLLLLKNLKNLYLHKEETIIKQTKKYSTGVQQLNQTQILVQSMKEELSQKKPILEQQTISAEETLKKIQEENAEADKTRMLVASEQKLCESQASFAEGIRKECESALEKTLPELNAAIRALDIIKKEDIDLVKTMHNPPEAIRITLEVIAIINRQKPVRIKDSSSPIGSVLDFYESGKKLLYIPKFIEKLKNFDRYSLDDEIIAKITPYIEMPKFHPDIVKYASSAAEGMCKWVRAMYKFYHVNKEIKPKEAALLIAQSNVEEKMAILKVKQAQLAKIEAYIESLRKDLEGQMVRKEKLMREIKAVELKMERAVKLIEQLSGERESWSKKVNEYSADIKNILGDVLLSAAFVSYMGSFNLLYREMALTQKWLPSINSMPEIQYTPDYSLIKVMGEPQKTQKWALSGLPSDRVSIENALIIEYSLNWPLIIDPQGQASKWLKKMFPKASKIKLETNNFTGLLENALLMGHVFMIEDIKETIDPVLDPLLMKQWYLHESVYWVKIGDSGKQIDFGFKLFLLSNLANPHFSAELSTKVTILNFTITEEGLSEQLLDLICRKEMPKDTHERDNLILQAAEYTKDMQIFEDKILGMLQSGGADILENEELIDSLTKSKMLSTELGKKLINSRQAEQRIDKLQQNYVPASKQSAVLYFCVADLVNIDFMYQFSMKWFTFIFKKALAEAEKHKDHNERVKNIIQKFRELLYSAIYISLNEDDKLLFTFLMSVRLQLFEKKILPWQWKFFLTGLCGFAESLQNRTDFLSEKSWREILQLSLQIPGIIEKFLKNAEKWKYFVSNDTNFTSLPSFEELSSLLPEPFDKEELIIRLLLIRAVKPEMLGIAIKAYVKTILGEKYLQPLIFNIASIYKETSPFKPLVFVLTPGTDPQSMIKRYTIEIGILLITSSLGKGQSEKAEKIIRECSTEGRWVLLQNCHLAPTWLPKLEQILDEISASSNRANIHRNFRLTLTSTSTPNFPVNILKKSVKAVSQLPTALSSSLLGIYSSISESKEECAFYESSNKPVTWRKLFFSLCFFHCVIRERGLFGPIGWNVKYEFSEGDFRISYKQLMQMVNQFELPPFEALIHLTAECNYGGKVTDDWDRRCLKEILKGFYNSEVLEAHTHSVIPVPGYLFPTANDFLTITNAIRAFPQVHIPEIFGLHANAEISRFRKEAYDTCSKLLALQPQAVSHSSDEQKSSILRMSSMILSKIPGEFNTDKVLEKYPLLYYESMNTVLLQELHRYNRLISKITNSLNELVKVYEGYILINEEYELLSESMLKNKIPELWSKVSYNSCKNLVSYIEDLKKRIEFFNTWIENGRPKVFWLSGIFFTQSFLTATLQEYARKNKIPIDTLSFAFEVIEEVKGHPEYGVYINGLYLEGARWQDQKLDECRNRELYFEFPTVLII